MEIKQQFQKTVFEQIDKLEQQLHEAHKQLSLDQSPEQANRAQAHTLEAKMANFSAAFLVAPRTLARTHTHEIDTSG
jgi:hypothetical protein